MVESGLIVRQFISNDAIQHFPGVMQDAKERLLYEMGYGLTKELCSAKDPITVKLRWIEDKTDFYGLNIMLKADLWATQTVPQRIIEPPLEYPVDWFVHAAPPKETEKPVMEWECGWCGQVSLMDKTSCPHCGAPRKALR
jgi:hypothetical protein